MKQYIYTFLAGWTLAAMMSCQDLDLNPLSSGSSETWNSTEDEIVMSLRDLYRDRFWPQDQESWTDDYTNRDVTSVVINGTLNGQTYEVTDLWDAQYKMISRANTVIQNAHRALNSGLSQAKVDQYVAEARFLRACAYSHLTEKFGDVPYVTDLLTIEEAFAYGRTPLAEVNQHIYEDFDEAIELLPTKYKEDQRATRWMALGFKARHALYMGDYALAAAAAKEVIENGPYTLHKAFGDLFLSAPTSSNKDEAMFIIPRSVELKLNVIHTQPYLPRTSGGYVQHTPSWDLLAAFLCTDGKTIDKSPLFDSHNPFENRDPRCEATIVKFGSNFLGYGYDPSPKAKYLYNYTTGLYDIENKDSRIFQQYASYNGLAIRKRVDETWPMPGFMAQNDNIIMRLAEMYLTYAEAKIELNQIDQSVLDAINTVRARAYQCQKEEVSRYPAVTTMDQKELRSTVRIERRMELAWEGMRYMDLVRWRLASIALKRKNYGVKYPMSTSNSYMADWFWAFTPVIDENGLPDFSEMERQGKVNTLSERNWDDRQYLWPIPTTDLQINENMTNNPGY